MGGWGCKDGWGGKSLAPGSLFTWLVEAPARLGAGSHWSLLCSGSSETYAFSSLLPQLFQVGSIILKPHPHSSLLPRSDTKIFPHFLWKNPGRSVYGSSGEAHICAQFSWDIWKPRNWSLREYGAHGTYIYPKCVSLSLQDCPISWVLSLCVHIQACRHIPAHTWLQ